VCDAVAVKVVDCSCYLVGYLPCSILCNLKFSLFKISEQVPSTHVLKHNVDVFRILEDIEQPNDVRVLAYFQDFYFSLLQLKLVGLHVSLLNTLDGHLLSSFLVDCKLNQAKLSTSQGTFNFIKVLNACVADGLLDDFNPLVSLVLSQ